MEPTIAIAPMQIVSDVLTNASIKRESLEPAFSFSQPPNFSNWSSIFRNSPIRAPDAMDRESRIAPWEEMASSVMTSIFSSAPAIPMNMTDTPSADMMIFSYDSFSPFFSSSPRTPPAMTASVLTIEPIKILTDCNIILFFR